MLGNSAFIAFVTVVLTLLISSMAAFVLDYLPAQKHIIAGLTAGAVKG
jgi:ABC-type glycerol-3-phosphate transport system permease component